MFVEKLLENRSLLRYGITERIIMDFRETGCIIVTWIEMMNGHVQIRTLVLMVLNLLVREFVSFGNVGINIIQYHSHAFYMGFLYINNFLHKHLQCYTEKVNGKILFTKIILFI
jgi:hypothetical protein